MAEGLNRACLLGNLGADPALTYTQGGQAVLKLSLATSESYLDKGNERQERTEWHRITVWGKRAEGLNKILRKGARIYVEGSIQTRSWEKDGEKRYATEINARQVLLCGGAQSGDGGGRRSESRGSASAGSSEGYEQDYGSGGGGGSYDDEIPF